MKLISEKLEVRGATLLASCLELENAVILIISEGRVRLGTTTIAIPESEWGVPYSSTILGERDSVASRMVAEHAAKKTGKIALASVHLKSVKVEDAAGPIMELVEKVLSGGSRG